MKVRDIMTRDALSCRKDSDVATAGRLMLEGRCGMLPVLDEHGIVAGVITDRDIALAAATRQRNASHIAVHEVMSEGVRSCLAGDELRTALRQMEEARVRRLPVLDATRHLAGVLSIDDIVLRAVGHEDGVSPAEFVEALRRIWSQPAVEPEMNFSETFTSG